MTLVLRAETLTDCDAVAAMHMLAWQVGYRGMLPDDFLAGLDVDQWADRRRKLLDTRPALVAERHGEIVGFTRFGPGREDETVGEIQAMYVHPDHWGMGIGDALMCTALDGLPQNEVQLWVLERNERALRFYARYGFHPDGTRSTYRPRGTEIEAPDIRCTLRRL
ncbi:MAG TPA: N-acetyltransferase [Micromonosporaceae bacterium]|nr:N-acetyltransferase [Micromonosporaceae bacterium]